MSDKQPFGVLVMRVILGAFAVVAVPPFVLLAIVPMLLMLAPVALVAIPFMICALAGEAAEANPKPRRVPALQLVASAPQSLTGPSD
jgi:hypothetical protein